MTEQDDGRKIVELLAKHEEAVAQLYAAYGEKFAERRDFWMKLSEEERQHAAWIRRINARIETGEGRVVAERFDKQALRQSLASIEAATEEAKGGGVSLSEAPAKAASTEDSIVENKYFEVFEGNCAEIKQVQYCLEEAARMHRERIEAAASRG